MSAKRLREAFAKKPLRSAVVEIDGVGKVMVKELRFGNHDDVDQEGTVDARARNIALTIYTEDGSERVFDHNNPADIEIIKGFGNHLIMQIIEALPEKN